MYRLVVIRFLLEGCIEIGLSAMICVTRMSKDSFLKFSDSFSNVSAILTLAALAFAPFYMARKIKRFLIKDDKARQRYIKFFEGLKVDQPSLAYNVMFFCRRYFMILVLTLLP